MSVEWFAKPPPTDTTQPPYHPQGGLIGVFRLGSCRCLHVVPWLSRGWSVSRPLLGLTDKTTLRVIWRLGGVCWWWLCKPFKPPSTRAGLTTRRTAQAPIQPFISIHTKTSTQGKHCPEALRGIYMYHVVVVVAVLCGPGLQCALGVVGETANRVCRAGSRHLAAWAVRGRAW